MKRLGNIDIDINNGIRALKAGGERYNSLFTNTLEGNVIHLSKDIDAEKTVNFMNEIVRKTLKDTERVGEIMRGRNIMETCHNVWQFVMDNIQYKPDKRGEEQLRRPLRLWKERITGGDCDCMAIFVNSCLINAGVPARNIKTRIASYHGWDDWQHVYTIVTDENGKEICVDAVIHIFNLEKKFTYKKDFPMSTTYLNGLGSSATDTLKQQLQDSLMRAQQSPKAVSEVSAYENKEFIYKLENLISVWDNEAERDMLLDQLAQEDDDHTQVMNGLYGELYGKTKGTAKGKPQAATGQAAPKPKKKKFFAQI